MPPSEGQEPRALIVAVQAIDGRKCAETAKVHPDLRIVYNLAYGVLADEAGRFPVTGNYTTTFKAQPFSVGLFRIRAFPTLCGDFVDFACATGSVKPTRKRLPACPV